MNEKSSPTPNGRKGWGAGESFLLTLRGALKVAPPSSEIAAHTLYGEGGPAACVSTSSGASPGSAAGKPPPAGGGALLTLVCHIRPRTPFGEYAIHAWKCVLAASSVT